MLLVNLILNIFTPTNKPVWLIVSKLYLGKFDETASLDLYLLHDRFSSVLPPTVSVEVKRKTYIFPLQCVRKAVADLLRNKNLVKIRSSCTSTDYFTKVNTVPAPPGK